MSCFPHQRLLDLVSYLVLAPTYLSFTARPNSKHIADIPNIGMAIMGFLPTLSLNDEIMIPEVQAGTNMTRSNRRLHLQV